MTGGGRELARTKKIQLADGRVHEAENLDFKVTVTPWTRIEVEDGTVLELSHAVTEVSRIKDLHNENGEPIYFVKHGSVLRADVPDKLIKFPSG